MIGIEEKALGEFQREELVDLVCEVPVSFEMSPHYGFHFVRFEIRPGKRSRV